jgi:hypothetical protein
MPKYSVAVSKTLDPNRITLREESPRTIVQILADKAGICLSVICIVHCVLTPVILLALPAMQIFEWWHGSLHIIFAIIIPLLALAAFIPGYRLHRDARVFKISLIGFGLIVAGITIPHALEIEWLEPVLSIAGSIFLVRAHLVNRNLCACCRAGHGKH